MSGNGYDVVVVGYGGAGAVAAIEAHDAGASVLILEATGRGGGSTRKSGGNIRLFVDPEGAVEYFHGLAQGGTPRVVFEAFVEGTLEAPRWLTALGAELAEVVHDVEGSPYQTGSFPYMSRETPFATYDRAETLGGRARPLTEDGALGDGETLWAVLDAAIAERGIEIRYGARARRLHRREDGRVVGLSYTVDDGSDPVTVTARGGVVLTCGGFAHDRLMQHDYLGVEIPALPPPGTSLGDGVRLGLDVGADLWHMNASVAHFGYLVPGHDRGTALCHVRSPGFFVVDQRGRRYYDESAFESHGALIATFQVDPVEGVHLRIPSYLIFDQQTLDAGAITNRHNLDEAFSWSADNRREVEQGWIVGAETISELAEALGLPGDALTATAERYAVAASGGPDELGRPAGAMRPLAGRLYGIAMWPILVNTQGGPRRTERAEVVDVRGVPIPGLFSAGELGSIWTNLYPGAGNLTECIVFGRIAGERAAEHSRA